jgi:hypothetical protein
LREETFSCLKPDFNNRAFFFKFYVMTPLKKGQPREEDRYMRGCGRSPHPLIYPSPLLEGSFFSMHSYQILAWFGLVRLYRARLESGIILV